MSGPEVSGGILRRRPFTEAATGPAGQPLYAQRVSPTIEESWALVELVRSLPGPMPAVLEIGTAYGYSAFLMAHAGAEVWTVDPHTDQPESWEEFEAHRQAYGLEERVHPLVIRSRELTLDTGPLVFAAAFVDGDHARQACAFDLELCWSRLAAGGWLAVHDCGENWPSVREACDEFVLRHGDELADVRQVETLLLFRQRGA